MNSMSFRLINKMVYFYPFISRLLFFSYSFFFQFIMINILFVIFLKSYNKVKQVHPLSLLSFRLLLDGLIEFFKNIYLKYFPNLNGLIKLE